MHIPRRHAPLGAACLIALGACAGLSPEPTEPTVANSEADAPADAESEPAEPAADSRAAFEASMAERIAAGILKMEAEMAEEKKRWTPEFNAKMEGLLSAKYADMGARLDAALASPHRLAKSPERDADRHPKETLLFFGVDARSKVVEVGPGKGWYTELLAFATAGGGGLTVTMGDPNGPPNTFGTFGGKHMALFLDRSEALFGHVTPAIIDAPGSIPLGEPGSADSALILRRLHNWVRFGTQEAYLKATYDVLKPGGVLGVVQHRAKPGADPAVSAKKGYLAEAWVIQTIEAAGFKLAEKSELNANPKDTKDYEAGVWALPPGLAGGDVDRAKYVAIGESDRMTLKFIKPTN